MQPATYSGFVYIESTSSQPGEASCSPQPEGGADSGAPGSGERAAVGGEWQSRSRVYRRSGKVSRVEEGSGQVGGGANKPRKRRGGGGDGAQGLGAPGQPTGPRSRCRGPQGTPGLRTGARTSAGGLAALFVRLRSSVGGSALCTLQGGRGAGGLGEVGQTATPPLPTFSR